MEERIVDDKDGTAVLIGTVEVGDGSGGEVSEEMGVVELKAAVIATTDDRRGDGMPGAGTDGIRCLDRSQARVLMKDVQVATAAVDHDGTMKRSA